MKKVYSKNKVTPRRSTGIAKTVKGFHPTNPIHVLCVGLPMAIAASLYTYSFADEIITASIFVGVMIIVFASFTLYNYLIARKRKSRFVGQNVSLVLSSLLVALSFLSYLKGYRKLSLSIFLVSLLNLVFPYAYPYLDVSLVCFLSVVGNVCYYAYLALQEALMMSREKQ